MCGNRGIKKGLSDIIKPDVLDKFNLEGTHNKMRLLQFPKFMSVLFCKSFIVSVNNLHLRAPLFSIIGGTYNEGNSDKSFKIDLRDALKLAKNRHCKDKLKNLNKSADKENACDGKVHTTDPEEDFFLKNIIEC